MESVENSRKGLRVQLEREVWAVPGCLEFFQQLGFKLPSTDHRSPWVTLSSPPNTIDKKTLHSAVIAIQAVFGKPLPPVS